jgi:hypothetical protein
VSYIFWTAQQFQLTELELQRLLEKAAPLAVPISTSERVVVFHSCLTILAIDNTLADAEVTKCGQIAKDLRLEERKTTRAFDLLKQKNGELISLNELQVIFGLSF